MVCSKQFEMKNNTLHLCVDLDHAKPIRSLSLVGSGVVSNEGRDLFSIHIYDKVFAHTDFVLESVERVEDETEEMVSAHYTLKEEDLAVKVHFINDRADSLRVLFQVWDGYKNGVPYAAFMRVPLLHELSYKGDSDVFLAPGCQFRSVKGKKIIMPLRDYQYSNDIRPPMVVLDEDKQHGFSVTFPALSDLNNPGCVQNQSKFFAIKETEREIREPSFSN